MRHALRCVWHWRAIVRVLCGTIMAAAIAIVATQLADSGCFPLCAIYNDSNPEYWLFLCYLC